MSNELSSNSTLSHYRIISKLGAGGMGEVYLAQDTKLDRRVAIKILPADLGANRDRLEQLGCIFRWVKLKADPGCVLAGDQSNWRRPAKIINREGIYF